MYMRHGHVARAGQMLPHAGWFFAVFFSVGLIFAPAHAANEVGQTLGVKPTSTASGRVLRGADIILDRDRIDTSARGEVQLEFLDSSRVLIGPNSSLGIERYLASAKRANKHVGVVALGGAVRFISSGSGERYTIKTPTATIGVRGTRFDVAVTRTRTAVLVYQGDVELCTVGGCVRLNKACDVGVADGRNAPSLTTSFKLEQGMLRRDFPYAFRARTTPTAFRTNSSACVQEVNLPRSTDEHARPVPPQPTPPSPPEPSKPHKSYKDRHHHGKYHHDHKPGYGKHGKDRDKDKDRYHGGKSGYDKSAGKGYGKGKDDRGDRSRGKSSYDGGKSSYDGGKSSYDGGKSDGRKGDGSGSSSKGEGRGPGGDRHGGAHEGGGKRDGGHEGRRGRGHGHKDRG